MKKKVTIIVLSLVVLLLWFQMEELSDSIQLKDENIKIIEIENNRLTQQLENSNIELVKYKKYCK